MLTGKTILGVVWSVATRLGNRLIDFVTLLVLARILTPADFGLVALATTLVAIVETVLEIALIQVLTRLPAIDKSHLDTAFTLGLLRGLALALVVLASALPFADIYQDDRLIPLIAALAIGPIARGLYSPGMVKFIRAMSFREPFFIHTAGKLIAAGLAIAVLFAGGGYWAIATSTVATSAASTLLSYVVAPYKPGFSLVRLKDFTSFLGWFSLSQLISAINWQIDRIFLGYFVSKGDLGRYAVASDLAVLPTQSLIGPAMQPVMAAFATIQDNPERLRSAYLKATRFTMMMAMPACVFIAIGADLIIGVLFDDQWRDAAPYLQWIALTTLFAAYVQPLYSAAVAVNKVRVLFNLNATELVLKMLALPVGFYYGGVFGVIGARGVVAVLMLAANALAARDLIGAGLGAQARNLLQPGFACAVFTAATLGARYLLAPFPMNQFVELAALGLAGAAAFMIALLATGMRPNELVRFTK